MPRKPQPKPAPAPLARGRPVHDPDEKSRGRVMAWAAGGIDREYIAKGLGISETTLRKHYRGELVIGKAQMDGLAVNTLGLAMQRGGKEAVIAAKFWCQSRMGWSERVIVDDGKAADTPLRVVVEFVGDAPAPRVDQSARTGSRLPDSARQTVQLVG